MSNTTFLTSLFDTSKQQLQTAQLNKRNELLKKMALAEQQAYLQGMQNSVVSGAMVTGIGDAGLLGQHNAFAARAQYPSTQIDSVAVNANPAMQIGLREAYDLWTVRWGDLWVLPDDMRNAEGPFDWACVANRLHLVGKMEHSSFTHGYRIIPLDVWK